MIKYSAFDKESITIPADSTVAINFDNQDSRIPHNFAVYTDSSGNDVIFRGDIITGPMNKTYTFKAPHDPGTYSFMCDIPPNDESGRDNIFLGNGVGIDLLNANNNTIADNTFPNNYNGIRLDSEDSNNTILGNNIIHSGDNGIYLSDSSRNRITCNIISYNTNGIYLSGSSDNILYQNNLISNVENDAYDDSINRWDNGTVGNYYSNFICKGIDGICS